MLHGVARSFPTQPDNRGRSLKHATPLQLDQVRARHGQEYFERAHATRMARSPYQALDLALAKTFEPDLPRVT
jgi:hypothetical protein